MDDPLIFVRAVHFAATLSAAGAAFFNVFIAQPALWPSAGRAELRAAIGGRLAWIAWIGLVLTLLSGAAWFILVAQSISDQPLASVLSDGSVLQSVLLDTDFGRDWLMRLLLIALLAGLLVAKLRAKRDSRGFLRTCHCARRGWPRRDIGLGRTWQWRRRPHRQHSSGRRLSASGRCGRLGGRACCRLLSCSRPRAEPHRCRSRVSRACVFPLTELPPSACSFSPVWSTLGIWRAASRH